MVLKLKLNPDDRNDQLTQHVALTPEREDKSFQLLVELLKVFIS